MAVTTYALETIRKRLEATYEVVTFIKTVDDNSIWECEKNGISETVKRNANFKTRMHNLGNCWQIVYGDEFAYIWKIQDHGMLAKKHSQYRVDDKRGRTVATMLDHFQTAKSIAIKTVKGVEV